MDGDSFAHRAFHALPRSLRRDDGGPANTLIGFTSMLLRLWQAEQPRAVVVGWDTLGVPTYRNALLPTYQSGREFDPEIVDQLELLPALVASTGIVCGKQSGYEADDFLAAAVAAERARGGTTLVATSDRDAFQLAAADVTILQPVRGVSELAADRARRRCASGTASTRRRCRTSSRCAATPRTRSRARAAWVRRPRPRCLQTYPDLEAMLAAGRFESRGGPAPGVPPHRDARPDRAASRSA